ncbi:MAG: hypothetical protein AB1671_08815 [Thermodesulfobacteriota bacterium]|jgi:hypothetical protein
MRKAVRIIAGGICLLLALAFGLGAVASSIVIIGIAHLWDLWLPQLFHVAFLICCVLGFKACGCAGLDFFRDILP